jgi:hypothetical protein
VVHVSELTIVIIWFTTLFVATQHALSSNKVNVASFAPCVAKIIHGAQHQDPTYKNSRSTRRERRNQQSVSIIV